MSNTLDPTTYRSEKKQRSILCRVDYSRSLDTLIRQHFMVKADLECIIKLLPHYEDAEPTDGEITLCFGLIKPARDTKTQIILEECESRGRPATLREVLLLLRHKRYRSLKKKIAIIKWHPAGLPLMLLAYWYDRAWRLRASLPNTVWRAHYRYEFAFVQEQLVC